MFRGGERRVEGGAARREDGGGDVFGGLGAEEEEVERLVGVERSDFLEVGEQVKRGASE